ncbi:SDR family NAD(P)-dependent oxidoreductase [Chloroflexota bacterium]
MDRLATKVAIITGAGSGIGRATAILFAKEGAKVVVADWVAEGGKETTKMIKEAGDEAIFVEADVSKEGDVKNMIGTAVDTYGKLDVLVNDAGITLFEGSTVECTEKVFDETIATNLKGVWLGMKYAIPEMLKTGGGSIVNLASVSANQVFGWEPAYSSSKAGVISLSRVTAVEIASQNIRVNCVAPGPIATPLTLKQWSKEDFSEFSDMTPRGKIGSPEEVAQVILFLASDESVHIIGQTLIVDGGISARAPLIPRYVLRD